MTMREDLQQSLQRAAGDDFTPAASNLISSCF
jgi:hypothetical protein